MDKATSSTSVLDLDPAVDLADGNWVRTVQVPDAESPPLRWRNARIDQLLAELPEPRPPLRRLLNHANRTVAVNAAIVLGRLGDAAATDALVGAVGNRRLSLPVRCAAAEALGRLTEPSVAGRLRELIDRHDHKHGARNLYVADLHAELIRGFARRLDPTEDRRFVDALQSPSSEVQLAALAAWESGLPPFPRSQLPIEAVDLRTSRDSRVRAASVRLLATRRHAKAHDFLAGALHDLDVPVRMAAIAGLGKLGDERARQILRTQLTEKAAPIRAAVVTALAAADDRQAVFDAAGDKSWRVRLAVARALSRYPDRGGATIARGLLDDPSTAVGPRVLESIRDWPLPLAGPLLLDAMGKQTYLVRKQAAEQLARRWPPADRFSHEAPPERRQEVLTQLTARFQRDMSPVDPATVRRGSPDPAAPIPPEQMAQCQRHLQVLSDPRADTARQREAIHHLAALGPSLAPTLERILLQRKLPIADAVYRNVLPELEPVFEVLDRLDSDDVTLKRRAAAELVELSARSPLGRLATERLASLVATESDTLVWRSVLLAVAADGREPSIRLATAAVGHPSPEIRRRGCEHLAAHPEPRLVAVLLPALRDPNAPVVLAAIDALVAGGQPEDTKPLEQLLGHDNPSVQLKAARWLAEFGLPTGTAALERLAHGRDPTIRREVAVAMGELADPCFTGTLVRLLDDGHGVQRAALAALPKVAGRDVAAPAVDSSPTVTQRIDTWKRWYERHGKSVGQRESPNVEDETADRRRSAPSRSRL